MWLHCCFPSTFKGPHYFPEETSRNGKINYNIFSWNVMERTIATFKCYPNDIQLHILFTRWWFFFFNKAYYFLFFLNHSNATKKLYFLWDLPILYGRNPWYQFQDDNNFIIRPRNLWTYVYLVDKTPDTPNMPRRHHLTKMVVFPDSYSNSSFSSSLCA